MKIHIKTTYFTTKEEGIEFIKNKYKLNPKKDNFYILLDFTTPELSGSIVINAKDITNENKRT